MPIVIEEYQADGDGGFYIRWRDPSQDNLVANIHATQELLEEFIDNFRTHRGAPITKLVNAVEGFGDASLPDAARVQRFRLAYSELIEDIIDLEERGLKHNTPHSVQKGKGKPDKKWLKNPDTGFDDFIAGVTVEI